jgi:hypothetical protein
MTAALTISVLALTSTVSAAATVRLHLAECVTQRDLVEDLVGIELGFERMRAHQAALEVHTACGQADLRIYIERAHTFEGPSPAVVRDIAERRIALTDVRGEGGPRLVALNIAELVQDQATLAAPPPAPALAAPAPTAPPPPRGPRLRLGAAPSVRLVPTPGRALPGVRLSVALDPGGPWVAELDAGFEQADAEVALGVIQTRVLTAALSGGLRLEPGDALALYLQAGLRGGWVWLDAEGADATVAAAGGSGPWVGPLVQARLRYGGRLGVALGLEGGWALYGVFGDAGGARFGLEDGWVGVDLRLDWRFGEG